jgi:hypothetical protein
LAQKSTASQNMCTNKVINVDEIPITKARNNRPKNCHTVKLLKLRPYLKDSSIARTETRYIVCVIVNIFTPNVVVRGKLSEA